MKKSTIIIIASVILVIGVAILAYFLLKPASEVIVSFDSKGGSSVAAIKVKKGDTVKLPVPTKEDETFLGWYLNETKIEEGYEFKEDVLLIAQWASKTYTITFDSKGGSKIDSITVECGKELTLPTTKPTMNGYTFVSWADKNGKVILDGALLACEDLTLYANWQKNETKKTYTITFDSKGGNKVNNITVTCGNKVPTLPTPKKDGYDFVSWYDKNGKTILAGANLSCENITLYADWKAQKTYKCPDGYKLSGTKCTKETAALERCPSGTKVDGSLCINTSVTNEGTRVCKSDTVSIDGKGHTWTGKGDYHFTGAYGKCAYYKWTSYTTKSQCEAASDINHRTVWVSDLNGCYAEDKMNNYETVCSGDYKYYSTEDLKNKFGLYNNGKCLKVVAKEKYCISPSVLTNGKCVETKDATLA